MNLLTSEWEQLHGFQAVYMDSWNKTCENIIWYGNWPWHYSKPACVGQEISRTFEVLRHFSKSYGIRKFLWNVKEHIFNTNADFFFYESSNAI